MRDAALKQHVDEGRGECPGRVVLYEMVRKNAVGFRIVGIAQSAGFEFPR